MVAPQLNFTELRRIAPQTRIHDICVAVARNRDTRLITLANRKPPKKAASHVTSTGVKTCFDDERDEKSRVTRNFNPCKYVTR